MASLPLQPASACVTKRANLEDEVTLQAYELFDFTTTRGTRRTVQIERSRARDPQSVYRHLLDANAALPTWQAHAVAEIQQAIDGPAPPQLRYAARLGWRTDGKGFVLSDSCVGSSGRRRDILPPRRLLTARVRVHRRCGSLKHWQQQVAVPACSSTALMLAIAAAFAAPLIKPMRQPNFGLNLAGFSDEERALVLKVATSVAGIGTAGHLPAVQVGLFGPHISAQPNHDLLFAATNWSPWVKQTRQGLKQLLDCIHRITDGQNPRPSSTATPAPSEPSWRGIFFLGSEHPIAERAAALGITLDRESQARCIDIPLGGPAGLFDRPPSGQSRKQRRRGRQSQLAQLRSACICQHGSPLRPYLKFLIQRRKQLRKMVGRLQTEFLADASKLRRSERQLASRIALIYAGGSLAIEAKLVPWRRGRLRAALQRCLQAACDNLRSDRTSRRAIRRTLVRRLRSDAIVPAANGERFGPAEHVGFYREIDGRQQFTVAATAFRRWFASLAHCRAAVRWLHKCGRLELRDKSVIASSTSTEWAERTPRWPDGRVHRSFVFFWDDPGATTRRETANAAARVVNR